MKELEAYKMMFRFLEERYRRLPSEALGALLGEMQLASDGKPFDPAIIQEWEQAVSHVERENRPVPIEQHRKAS